MRKREGETERRMREVEEEGEGMREEEELRGEETN